MKAGLSNGPPLLCTCMAAIALVVAPAVAVWGLALDGLGRYHLHESAV